MNHDWTIVCRICGNEFEARRYIGICPVCGNDYTKQEKDVGNIEQDYERDKD